jgi:nicotinamidase-related amidase
MEDDAMSAETPKLSQTALVAGETAVVVIDMLNDFITGALKCERAQAIVPNIRALLDAARTAGAHVVYSTDAHSPDDHEIKVAWHAHAMAGTEGAEIIPELAPKPGDHVSKKTSYSGFYGTDLDEHLQQKGIKTLVLTGVLTNCCIQYIAGEAFVRGYRIIVPPDCVEALTGREHTDALAYIKFWFKAETPSSSELVDALGKKKEE